MVEFFGQKWSKGGEDFAEVDEDEIEGGIGGGFVGGIVVFAETAAGAADKPVAEVGEGLREVVGVHARGDFGLELGKAGDDPEIEGVL